MTANLDELRRLLKGFDFKRLFIERLGWDRHQTRPLVVPLDGINYTLDAVAQKRGMVVYVCSPGPEGDVPDAPTRRRLEKEVTKAAYEHILVFTDAAHTAQVWQWVRRQHGKPAAFRQHTFHKDQPGDSLIQKLQAIRFTLDEEERLTQPEVPGRVRQAFDVDRITKRFYELFKKEHAAFLGFIKGIASQGDREWYASVMLNRLMFVYFIQKQGFLDGDEHYLRHRLERIQKERGAGKFHSFYRRFLLRLFHEGLGQLARTAELDKLLGKVPYLNGGIFELHELERDYKEIDIPDEAFARIFAFFDAYQWHLDDRPLAADNQINPDVLGYIFEKYINQKQMGAYYTKEDITGYNARYTILPFLLNAAAKVRPDAFRPDGPVWRLLRDDPDKYIYDAVRHGVDLPLPAAIKTGVKDVNRRDGWNRPAADGFNLPTETWREYVERRTRCHELRRKMRAGEVHGVNDLITYNLDVCQFTQDVIDSCDDPGLSRAIWAAVEKVSVLDPTCGSGAFLFAALNILEPLYEACLDRMQWFLEEQDAAQTPQSAETFADFRKVLDQIERHPSRHYFIYKSIIINNLYGVDIMKEAVEICKLRLFLKLVSQVRRADQLEPLPDIDFNIRAGNTLVGFVSLGDVRGTGEGKLLLDPQTVERILAEAQDASEKFRIFREMQTEFGANALNFKDAKTGLLGRLARLREQLDRHLANEYDVDPDDPARFDAWRASHMPFHWFTEFYGIMAQGGFDVIIGNPPYVVYTPAKVSYEILPRLYKTWDTKNLYAYIYERSFYLGSPQSCIGLIVQLTVLSSEKLDTLQNLLFKRGSFYGVSFPRRPESVFDGVEMPVAIILSFFGSPVGTSFSSRVSRFYTEERPTALASLRLVAHNIRRNGHRVAKIGTTLEEGIYKKLAAPINSLASIITRRGSTYVVYYQEACRYWLKACVGMPFFKRNAKRVDPPHGRTVTFNSKQAAVFGASLANSSLFYWFYSVFSDCEHVNDSLVREFPIPDDWQQTDWLILYEILAEDLKIHSKRKTISTKQGHTIEYDEMKASLSKHFIDQIDRSLASHYGFTDEELDFILNYDIKYRMGQDTAGDEDDE